MKPKYITLEEEEEEEEEEENEKRRRRRGRRRRRRRVNQRAKIHFFPDLIKFYLFKSIFIKLEEEEKEQKSSFSK